MIVKVCGLTTADDAAAAAAAGADWIGLNFWPPSKRFVSPLAGRAIAAAARAARPERPPLVVGVFVNQPAELVAETAAALALDWIQLHGDEPPAYCARFAGRYLKALAPRAAAELARLDDYDCEVVLVDAPSAGYGGAGRTGDWALARAAAGRGKRVLLAGGLTPDNVAAAIAAVAPWGVDVASGVESAPGRKDAELMRRFVAAARG